ncbi:hypothetical protein PWT90_08813 [Aphanocladium album]|nr:hypothetical protein PWT90_08813 [Aphanocladium album]
MVASTLEHLIVPEKAWTIGASKLQSIERLSLYPESILASNSPQVHGVLDVKEVLALPTRLQMSAIVRANGNGGLVASYSGLQMCREIEESTIQKVQEDGIQPKTQQTQNGSKLAQSLASCQDDKEQSNVVLSALMARLSKLTGIPSANIHPATQLASCGLDSLMAADLRNWCLKTVGVTLTVAEVIKSESLRALVGTIVQRLPSTTSTTKTMDSSTHNNGAELDRIPRVAECGKYPLSSFQSRLWFTQMLVEDTKMFNCRLLFMLDGNVHGPTMKAAWEALALSNTSFRTTFIDGEAYTEQTIVPMTDVDLPFHDLSSSTNANEELERLSRSIQAKDLDLTRGEVIRLALVRLREGKYCVVFIVHHLVFDRGSCPRLLEQLTAFYDNIKRQQPLNLSRWKQTQYVDYVSWQSQQTSATSIKAHLDYWKQSLSGVAAEVPLLPFAKQQRGNFATFRILIAMNILTHRVHLGLSEGIHTSVHRTILDVRLLRRMKRVCSTLGLTPFHFILASFMAFFHRYTGVTDQVVLAVDGSRPHPDVADIIGLFVNMLPIRLVSDYDGTMCDIFKATKLAALEGSEHPVPFDEIVRAVGVKTEPGVFLLGQVALNYQVHGTMPNVKTDDFSVARLITEDVPTACDMSLEAIEDPQNGLRLALEHSTVLYDRVDMERFLQNFVCFTESIIKDHFQPVKEVPMSGEMEMKLIKSFWAENEPWRLDHCQNLSIGEIIRQAAAAHSERFACIDNMGTRLTYKQLIDAADGTTASLKQRGIQPGDHVGLYCDPGKHEIIGILGIVFARCAYVALDPKFAPERLNYMARDSGARVILTGHEPPTTMFEELELLPILEASKCKPIFQQEPSKLTDPLYVTYTSGSTGRPKGTIMSHANALPMLLAIQEQFGFTAADNFLHEITMAFDLSVVQIFSPLLVGATMSIATAEARQDAFLLASFMRNTGVTFTYFTPTQFALVLEAEPEVLRACRKWKTAWFCGEAFPGKLARSWHDHQLPAALYNTYGPCEAMVQATIYSVPLNTSRTGVVPIGSPLPTVQSYILDAALNPLPIGVEGELYLGGPQVGSAYLNNPEATKQSFVDDPFVESKFLDEELLRGKKMFKTGDVCRLDKKNTLHFVGRVAGDRMIKLRGLRIDTSEVEEQIQATTLAKISRVCVIARDSRPAKASAEAPGLMDERVLFAFVVFAGQPPADTVQFVQQLTESLRKNLNEYMLPVGYIVLDQMPMTGSGTIDRLNMRDRDLAGSVISMAGRAPAATPAALPLPRPSVDAAPPTTIPQEFPAAIGASLNGQATVASQANHPPAISNGQFSDAAREMAFSFVVSGIQEILSVPAALEIVGSTSFFELGGSSLTLMRLHGKIKRQYGAIVTLKKLFASPTVDGIVALLAPAPITNGSQPETHPTSAPSALDEPALARKIDAPPTAKQWDWNQEISLPDNANFNVPTSNDMSLFTLSDPTDIFLTGIDTFHGLHVSG